MRQKYPDLIPGQDYVAQVRANNGTSVSGWSTTLAFRTDGDITPPSPVSNLTWVATGDSFMGRWTKPTTETSGKTLKDFKDFRVDIVATIGGVQKTAIFYTVNEQFEFTIAQNAQTFGEIAVTTTINVRVRDTSDNLSEVRSLTTTEDTPPVPSQPVLSTYLGQIVVTWDGKTSSGTITPYNLSYVEIHASTTTGFTPSATTAVARLSSMITGSQQMNISNVGNYGQPVYVKLVAVNKLGRKSTPSAQSTATPSRITNLDIQNGTISVDQINFVDQLGGGGKAFYGTSFPTSGMNDGDTFFDTDDFYNQYVYNENQWKPVTYTGPITGSRIVAGTITADQIGTNKIITSSANIGTAVIDSANIANLNAAKITSGTLLADRIGSDTITARMIGTNEIIATSANIANAAITSAKIASLEASKITAGTISAELTISGRLVTSMSGQRTEINSLGIFGYADDDSLSFRFNGMNNILTGTFQTATSGRRILQSSAGATGQTIYYAPDGRYGRIVGFTESTGSSLEATRFESAGRDSNGQALSYINLNSDNYSSYRARIHEFQTTPNSTLSEQRFVYFIHDGQTRTRLLVNNSGMTVHGSGNAGRFQVDNTGAKIWGAFDNMQILNINDNGLDIWAGGNKALKFKISNSPAYIQFWPTEGGGSIRMDQGGGEGSPVIAFYNNAGFAVALRAAASSTSQNMDVMNGNQTAWYTVRASGFAVQSDAESKTEPKSVSRSDMLEEILGLRVRRYHRLNKETKEGKIVPNTREEVGFIAQETSSRIDYHDSENGHFVDLYQTLALTVGSVQALHRDFTSEIDALRNEIKELKTAT